MPSWIITLTLVLIASSIGTQAARWFEWLTLPQSQRSLMKSDADLMSLENSLRNDEIHLLNLIRTAWTTTNVL